MIAKLFYLHTYTTLERIKGEFSPRFNFSVRYGGRERPYKVKIQIAKPKLVSDNTNYELQNSN